MNSEVEWIWFVDNPLHSAEFYGSVVERAPRLLLPTMVAFDIGPGMVLGLMRRQGIERLLGIETTSPRQAGAQSELYWLRPDAAALYQRALSAGARNLSDFQDRDWGHRVAYVLDPDGHLLAFAESI
ncbi:glyoxalase [bacterium]|nr:glyoxalase [bacterium]